MLVTHFSGLQVPVLEPQTNPMTAGNAFLGLQHWYFWQNGTFSFVENDDEAKSVLN